VITVERHAGRLGAASVLALALASAPAAAADRVIPPAGAKLVFDALGRAGPGFTLVSARVEGGAVWASVCRTADPTRCFSLALAEAAGGCAGARAGAWCVAYPDGPPPDEAGERLLAALGALRREDVWVDAEVAPRAAASAPPPPPEEHRHPFALALALVAVPLAAGLALGHRLRRTGLLLAAVPLVAAAAALPALRRVGAWDVLAAAVWLGLGLVAGAARLPARALLPRAALAIAAAAVALGVLEAASRALPEPAAAFAPPGRARLFFAAAPGAERCAPLYPAADPSALAERTAAVRPGAPLVLHVGDSMVEGVGVPRDEAFPAVLGRMDPAVDHVNAGWADSSLDAELLVARAWTGRLRVARVVLYVFGANDLAELDRASPCCVGGPLLDAAGAARCDAPGLPSSRLDLLAASPPPYPVRVATAGSALARRAALGFGAIGRMIDRLRRGPPSSPEARWARYASLLGVLRDDLARRSVPLTVVYLPSRAALESAAPRETADYALRGRVLARCRELGVPALDPWEMLEAAVRDDGAARWFLPPPDIHFTREGHRRMAEWLASRL
jgi:lysophospholipase L1-like esterase